MSAINPSEQKVEGGERLEAAKVAAREYPSAWWVGHVTYLLDALQTSREETRRLRENLWQCPEGHLSSDPQPIPGQGDKLGLCPYPCGKRVRRLASPAPDRPEGE